MKLTDNHVEVFGIPVTCFSSYDHAVKAIVERIRGHLKTVCVAINPEKVCFARNDEAFASIVRRGNLYICDGAGTCAAVRLLKGWPIHRLTGVNLFFALLKAAEASALRLFLFGATPQTNNAAYERLRESHPRLQIAGRLHGYHEDNE